HPGRARSPQMHPADSTGPTAQVGRRAGYLGQGSSLPEGPEGDLQGIPGNAETGTTEAPAPTMTQDTIAPSIQNRWQRPSSRSSDFPNGVIGHRRPPDG